MREWSGESADSAARRAASAAPVAGDELLLSVLAERLDRHPVGEDLVEMLLGLDLAELDDAELVEVVAGWERTLCWAAARQLDAVGELLARRTGSGDGGGGTQRLRYVGDEIGARLGLTRHAAEQKVAQALALADAPEVYDALAAGEIDARKAQVLTDETATLTTALARQVHRRVLPEASRLSGADLRRWLRRAVLAIDGAQAAARLARARGDRHVQLVPVEDAMAWLSFYLPADAATAAYTALDVLAGDYCASDARSAGARRVDAFTDLMRSILDTGRLPDGTALPTPRGRRPHLYVTVAASTLEGHDELPGDLAGYGPIPASMARDIAADADRHDITVDPRTGTYLHGAPTTTPDTNITPPVSSGSYIPSVGLRRLVQERDRTCTFPGCRVPAWRCQLDHIEPFDHTRPAREQTVETNLHLLCLHHHQMKTHGRWSVRREQHTGRTIWTAPTGHTHIREPDVLDPTTAHAWTRADAAQREQRADPGPSPPPHAAA